MELNLSGAPMVWMQGPHWSMTSQSALGVSGGKIYFAADDAVHGKETWVSDGTFIGTKLYAETVDGTAAFPTIDTIVVGSDLYIFAVTGIGAPEIFKIVPPQN